MMTFFNTYVPNPVAIAVFGVNIRWYGILIGIGILSAVLIAYKRAPKHEISSEKVLDILLICLPVGIIGARAYYVLFNWSEYSGDFVKMINIRLGGLAIHGALLAGILACVIICGRRNIGALNLFDLFAPCVALAQSIGRWGNYFNSEAHGGPTGLAWGIPVDGQLVHPTFLYESIWCFVLFWILLAVDDRRAFPGQVVFLYGLLYSLERFFVEWLRTDSLMLGPLKQAQVLSAAVFFICFVSLLVLQKAAKNKGKIFY